MGTFLRYCIVEHTHVLPTCSVRELYASVNYSSGMCKHLNRQWWTEEPDVKEPESQCPTEKEIVKENEKKTEKKTEKKNKYPKWVSDNEISELDKQMRM